MGTRVYYDVVQRNVVSLLPSQPGSEEQSSTPAHFITSKSACGAGSVPNQAVWKFCLSLPASAAGQSLPPEVVLSPSAPVQKSSQL